MKRIGLAVPDAGAGHARQVSQPGPVDRLSQLSHTGEKREAPKGCLSLAARLAELTTLAGEGDLTGAADVAHPLGSPLLQGTHAALIDGGPIANAELDVVKTPRECGDVLGTGMVPGPHVDVHDHTGGRLDTPDVHEDDLLAVDIHDLGSECHVLDAVSLEIHGRDVVDVRVLGKVDVCHNG